MKSLFNHANGNNIYIDAREPTHNIQVLKNNVFYLQFTCFTIWQ